MEHSMDFQYPPEQSGLKHSGLGIASFVLAMVGIVLFMIMMIVFVMASGDFLSLVEESGGQLSEDQIINYAPSLMIVGLFFMFIVLISLIGGILGIVGLFQKNRKKLFAILGTVFNLAGWAFFLLLMVIGMLSNAALKV